jgi:hypothetical protein
MINPAGAECAYYYEDFQRGANRQECRALDEVRSSAWQPSDCARCPVPTVLAANGSPLLRLAVTIRPGVLGIGRRLLVEARCTEHGVITTDPRAGCEECNAQADELLRRVFD